MLLKRATLCALLGALAACRTSEPAPASIAPDAGRVDAGADSEPPYVENPLLPASLWKPIPGLPHDCPDRIAIDPNAAVPPLEWKACASGRVGCERVDANWSPRIYQGVYAIGGEPIRRLGGRSYITFMRQEVISPGRYSRQVLTVLDSSGRRLFAKGHVPDACVGDSLATAGGMILNAIPANGRNEHLIFSSWGAPNELRADTLDRNAMSTRGYPTLVHGSAAGAIFFYTENPQSTAIYDSEGRKVILAMDGAKRLNALAYAGADEGAVTMIPTGDRFSGLGYIDPAGNHSSLLQAQPKHNINAVTVDRGADPQQMVWIEAQSDGGDFLSTEIWTSPLAKTSAGIQRRLVAKDPYGSGFTLAALVADRGLVVFKNGLQSARLVRLSDGKGWTIPADTDHNVSEIMGITDDSVWLLVSKRDAMVPDVTEPTAIQRVRLDSLGDPTVPSGL